MDLQERRQLDVIGQVARVRARAQPWRSIIALVLALAAVIAVDGWGWELRGRHPGFSSAHLQSLHATGAIIVYSGSAAFCFFGAIAALGLSGKARSVLQPVIGSSHAAVVRYALVLVSAIVILLTVLHLVRVPVGQLVVGGALTGVLIGIAAQQALANVFAGLVLLFARPFNVGDRVWIRSGALSGTLEGTVTEISITYVRLDTSDGLLAVPNSLVLAAVVGPARHPAPQPVASIAWQPGNPAADHLSSPAAEQSDSHGAVQPVGAGAVQPVGAGAVQPVGAGAVQPGGAGAVQPEGASAGAVQPEGAGAVQSGSLGAVQPAGSGAHQAGGRGADSPGGQD